MMFKKLLIGIGIIMGIAIGIILKTDANLNNMKESIEAQPIAKITINQSDIELIAKTIYGEARGCTVMEQSAVVWCILNRVDDGYGTIEEVITARYQFTGYKVSNPVEKQFVALAEDVIARWQMEKYCIGDVGRTLPSDYLFFRGDGKHNHFRNAYNGDYDIWDWSCDNPYLTVQN